MVMVKLASPQDWVATKDSNPVEIKVSSTGFQRGDWLKVAAEVGDRFIHEVRKIEDTLDHTNYKYAHVISCGATEVTGCNRNGDGWSKEALLRDMPTYTKHARLYRDHINKKDSPAYGHVKLAMFDSERGYGRLLVALNANSKIAKDRGEYVADKEIEQLEKQGEVKVSHGTTVGSDTCVHCGNIASKRSEYCESKEEGGNCPLFGCKHGMSKVADDGRIQFVDNPKNVFYDISSIGLSKQSANQADRIAFGTLLDKDLTKLSAEEPCYGSAWLAEQLGITPRYDLIDLDGLTPHQQKMAMVAVRLVEAEQRGVAAISSSTSDYRKLAYLHHSSPSLRRGAVATLAARNELPGPRSFAKAAGVTDLEAATVEILTQGLLSKLVADDMLLPLIKQSEFTCDPGAALGVDTRAPECSLAVSNLTHRRKLAAIEVDTPATTVVPHGDIRLAKIAADYIAMKVLFASQICGDPDLAGSLIASVQKG